MAMSFNSNFVTTAELSKLMKYDCRTIREQLKDSVLIEGVHYIRPFGGRKILYDWDTIKRDMRKFSQQAMAIPMTSGGVSHG
jgi:DeoR/GlpR family transcriptional regulator of sugar metabolism